MNLVTAQNFNIESYYEYENALNDVVEITDKKVVLEKVEEVEGIYRDNPNLLNTIRLGLIYHEVAFNLTFIDNTKEYKGYPEKSYNVLDDLAQNKTTPLELRPIIDAYRGSALSLMSSETRKLNLLGKAFDIFEKAIKDYAEYSPRPEFLRGSVAENLPFFMWRKRSYAKKDFTSLINKYEEDKEYADFRLMSFTYWAWANLHQNKKHRNKALDYLDKAIKLDPNFQAGREKAEELRGRLIVKR